MKPRDEFEYNGVKYVAKREKKRGERRSACDGCWFEDINCWDLGIPDCSASVNGSSLIFVKKSNNP